MLQKPFLATIYFIFYILKTVINVINVTLQLPECETYCRLYGFIGFFTYIHTWSYILQNNTELLDPFLSNYFTMAIWVYTAAQFCIIQPRI